MEEKKLVPKLRFPGFTEPWEQRKLGEEAIEILAGGDIEKEKVVYDSGYPIYANALTNDGLVGYYTDYYRVEAPAVTVTGRGEVGHAQARSQNFTPIVRLLAIRSKHDCYFLENAINNYKTIVESTGVPQLTVPQLSAYKLCFPLNIEEEKRISICFQNLDTLITLHQRKLEHLKLKKKSLLQKLFPKEGEVYPELRFPGFTAPWEQRKFGELFILKSGVAFKLSEYTKTGIPIINGESIKAGKISLEKVNYLPNEYQYKYQECLLFPGDIVLGLNRPIIDGELKISRIPSDIKTCLLYQRAGKIIFKVNMEENFTYQLLSKEVLTFTRREAVGSDQPFITTTKLNKWNLYLPVKDEERRKIGNLLDNINNIITLHQRKLEHLQLLKKALLQQLFV